MTLADIDNQASLYTNTTTTVYTAAQRLINLNLANNEIQTEIWKAQDEFDYDDSNQSDYPILTANLVASQQDYALETDTRRIRRLEVSYDGTNWFRANPLDLNENRNATDATSLTNDFTVANPYYDVSANAIFLYPIPTATGSMKIWVDRDAYIFTSSDVTAGTKSPGFDAQFHRVIPMIMAREWFMSKDLGKVSLYEGMIDKAKNDLKIQFSSKQKDRKYGFTPNLENYS